MFRGVACVPLTLLVLTFAVPMGRACPRSCNCYQANEVHCTFRSLLTVPSGLPVHTRRLNLGFNSISSIRNSSLAGLKKAELLMLHSNDLHHLPDAAFRDMKSLQILKLSYNKLTEIASSLTFSGLTSLLRLYLDHNLLQHIHPRALLQLPGLRLLRLQGNRLHQLHPHALCTVSLLNTYYFSTLRHLDLSNNSLTALPRETLATAPLLEALVLQANPWSCDCKMRWFLTWSLAHPGPMKCPGSPQCPICASPNSLQGHGLLDQTDLSCTSPAITSPGRDAPLEAELGEIQSSESFRKPLGSASLALSDQQGNSVDLGCNITHSADSQDVAPPPDLSLASSSPIPLALSLALECAVEKQSYETLWRILAYYSETAVRLEREIMLSKAPALAYRYRQVAQTGGYYHTGVKASVQVRPHWLLQPAISIQLNRAQSNGHKVQITYSTRVAARPDAPSHAGYASHPSTSSPPTPPWVLISTNHTTTALAAVVGSKVELSCPLLSSGNPKVQWLLPDGSMISPSRSQNGRLQATNYGLLLQKVQLSESGIYHCIARAGSDVDVLHLRLAVEESSVPPLGERVGPPVTGNVGEPITLSCNASGSPAPLLSWVLPDGNIVRQGLAVSGGLTMQSDGSLSLTSPSQRDVGHFRCIAVNHYGSDSLSTKLQLNSRGLPLLRTSSPTGPQSAAGRSTKIRAPLLAEEGSGDEREEDEIPLFGKRPRPLQPTPRRRYPIGKPRRLGPIREGPFRRGGVSLSSNGQRRNRFDNRHRVTTNKQRIDPHKWADLLAKIRQKTVQTNNSQPTAEPQGRGQGGDRERHEGHRDAEGHIAEGAGVEAENEGSSIDDTDLQDESLQHIQPTQTDTRKHTEVNTDEETDTEMNKGKEGSTETEEASPQTVTMTNPDTKMEPIASRPVSGTNEIVPGPGEGGQPGANANKSRTRPQRPRQELSPNLLQNSRPQSRWNSGGRTGQQRRIKNRPRGRLLTPPRPRPDSTNPRSQTAAPAATDQMKMLLLAPTTTPPAIPPTRLPSAPVSHTRRISPSKSASPSLTPSSSALTSLSPPHTNIHIDTVTHSAEAPDTARPTLSDAQATEPAHPDTAITQTREPHTHTRTRTQGIGRRTETNNALGKRVDGSPRKQSEEPWVTLSAVPYESLSSHSLLPTSSPVIPFTVHSATINAKLQTTPSVTHESALSSDKSTTSTSTGTTASGHTFPTTAGSTTMNSTITPITTASIIPTPGTTRSTTVTTPSTTTTTATPFMTSTSTTTSSTRPSTTDYSTNATTAATTSLSTTISFKAIPTARNPTTASSETTSSTSSSRSVASAQTSPTAANAAKSSTSLAPAAATMVKSTARRPVLSGGPNQSQPAVEWKNSATNSIPDSHSSRPHWLPSLSLPAAPGGSAVRSGPRIADAHNGTVSFPAESTASLACDARGEPKPSVTWTRIAAGAVIPIHSSAQRFEVLPNGTLVIQNVQLQDRGTYICSAHSVIGRDRSLTTLEVWTRRPRMQLASYREATIHQGGEVQLECRADGVPSPLLSWVLPDRSVLTSTAPHNGRVAMDENGTLHIAGTLPSDRGVYRCEASNSAGVVSASARVHVSSLPPVIQQPREEHLLLFRGWPVYAHCSARGAPPPTLRWRIPDGTLVRPSQFLHGNLFVLPNGTLHIRGAGPKESGNYECIASNAVGADKRTVRIKIQGAAEGEKRYVGGKSEGVKAVAAGSQSPITSLHKERPLSRPLPSNPSHPFISARLSPASPFARHSATLLTAGSSHSSSHLHRPNSTNSPPKINERVTHFSNKNQPSSLSTPSRVPSNTAKVLRRISSSSSDKVRAALHPSPVSPFSKAHIVSTSPSVTTVHYGFLLQLHCSVTGNPSPIIIWRTPNRKLVDMHFSFDRRLKVHSNGTLSVQRVTEKDAGDYLCIARNKVSDDYRLLRVSVVTKPAKIEPKQPLTHMVSLGHPLKVDCQASGLPDPAVQWSLPDGTTVNSVLQGEDRGGRAQMLTVFDNGTLLVQKVGVGEEGDYTCYAENQGGQDTMKVKVKVMSRSPPNFSDDGNHQIIRVRLGATASIRCEATGAPSPTVTWFSPTGRVIPQSLGPGFHSERVVAISDGTLQVRLARKADAGNYTCRVSNSAGEKSKVVGLETEAPDRGVSGGPVAGRVWSRGNGPGSGPHSRSGDGSVPNPGTSSATNSSAIVNNGNIVGSSRSTVRGESIERNPGTYNNEVFAGKASDDANTSGNNGRIIGTSQNVRAFATSVSNNGVGSGTLTGNALSRSSSSSIPSKNSTRVVSGVVTTVKQRAVKGQIVLLPCPSQGSPPPRLAWRLPGGRVLPAPHYGSRLVVHRNGSLELRGVRASDGGTFACVVGGEREQTRMQVELEVSEPQDEAGSPRGRAAAEEPVQENRLVEAPRSGASLLSAQSLNSKPVPPETLHPRISVTREPPRRAHSVPDSPPPVAPPPQQPALSTRTAPLVSIVNGETLRLPCYAPTSHGGRAGTFSWITPGGEVLSLGESGDKYSVQEDGTLTVPQASVFDRGTYTCRSTSADASSVSVATVPVIVIAYPPRITAGPSPVTYTRTGVAVELRCQTIATPRATITWETPDLTQLRVTGQARIYGNRYLSPQGSMVVNNPTRRDTGFYRCTARNVLGVDTQATYLHVM